jgi:hypothetical protein
MFQYSKFNRDISNWHINGNISMRDMFDGCTIKEEYKPNFFMYESFDFDKVNK